MRIVWKLSLEPWRTLWDRIPPESLPPAGSAEGAWMEPPRGRAERT